MFLFVAIITIRTYIRKGGMYMIYDYQDDDFIIDFDKFNMEVHSIIKKTGCPYCRNQNISKYGYTSQGRKRYICKSCGRTFSETTGTPIYNSKKAINKWIEYIECMSKSDTLREISSKLKISLTTAFQWRHKILHAVKSKVLNVEFCNEVEIGETVMEKNYKGNHHGKPDYKDDYNEIRILSCVDNNSRMVMGIDEPFIRKTNLDHVLKGKIKINSIITTARNMSYVQFARENSLKMNMAQGRRFSIYSHLDNKKAVMQGRSFINFTKSFCGVATRYINFYSILYVIKLINNDCCKGIFENLYKNFFISNDMMRERDFDSIKLV